MKTIANFFVINFLALPGSLVLEKRHICSLFFSFKLLTAKTCFAYSCYTDVLCTCVVDDFSISLAVSVHSNVSTQLVLCSSFTDSLHHWCVCVCQHSAAVAR